MLEMVTRYRLSILKLILILALSSSIVSCEKNPITVWSLEARSPDGRWLATIQRDQYSGPGNALLLSRVYLKHTAGPQEAVEVLEFEENQGPAQLKMNWLSSAHLEVTYTEPVTLDFQAVRCCGGVDISVRNLSRPVSEASAADIKNCTPSTNLSDHSKTTPPRSAH